MRKRQARKYLQIVAAQLIFLAAMMILSGGCSHGNTETDRATRYYTAGLSEAEDSVRLEQAVADFAGLMRIADDTNRRTAMRALVDEYAPREAEMMKIDRLIRKYLDDPNSPLRDEDIFILYLRDVIANKKMPSHIVERAQYSLSMAMKNRPGSVAADFSLLIRKKAAPAKTDATNLFYKSTLHSSLACDTTLIIFHDPDCEQCKKLIAYISGDRISTHVCVMAIDVTGDTDRWLEKSYTLPDDWIDAFATTPIEDEDLYAFPALPAVYFLRRDGTVIGKDIKF